jgi:hypothetical protein
VQNYIFPASQQRVENIFVLSPAFLSSCVRNQQKLSPALSQMSVILVFTSLKTPSMQKPILSLILVFFSITAFCQGDLKNGFIINLAHDTIAGRIDFGNPDNAHKHCVFKPDDSPQWTTYTPTQLIGYRINDGQYFISKQIPGDSADAVFIEVLATGPLTLYKFENFFFVQKEGNEMIELAEEMLFMDVPEGLAGEVKTKLVYSTAPLQILNSLIADCNSQQLKLNPAKLTEKFLRGVINKYNECKQSPSQNYSRDSQVTIEEVPPKTLNVRVIAGVSSATSAITTSKSSSFFGLDGKIKTDLESSILLGAGIELKFQRVSKRLSLVADVISARFKYKGKSNPYKLSSSSTRVDYLSVTDQQLAFPIGIKYKIKGEDFSPFFSAGLCKIFSTYKNTSSTRKYWYNELIYAGSETVSADTFKRVQSGYFIGMGASKQVKKSALSLELRYQKTKTRFLDETRSTSSAFNLTFMFTR